MYSTKKYFPKEKEKLLELLYSSVSKTNPIAIIGGHFMLFYDKVFDELKPVVWQELENDNEIKFAQQNAGNFPARSFVYSVELFKLFQKNEVESGLILLVNDHKFQSKNFQPNIIEYVKGRGGELRKKFFQKNAIPAYFLEIMNKEEITLDEFIINNNSEKRQSTDLLPKISWFHSEQNLRNRFDDYAKHDFIKQGYIKQNIYGDKIELYYESPAQGHYICLTENGTCACSAEVIELIIDLLNREMKEIIFFVPNECISSVDNGIMAALNIKGQTARVLTVSNFGGMGFNEEATNSFVVTEHIFENG